MNRVALLTDEPVLAEGLKGVLAKDGRFRLIATYSSRQAAPKELGSVPVDILLIDWDTGLSLAEISELRNHLPGCRVILWARGISTELAFQAVEQGVSGILRKESSTETTVQCLRVVSEGGLWFENSLQDRILGAPVFHLSPRESSLVALLAQGMKNKEIAALLTLSEATVKVYLCRLYRKLGVKDRFELALFGLRNAMDIQKESKPETQACRAAPRKLPPQSQWLSSLMVQRIPLSVAAS